MSEISTESDLARITYAEIHPAIGVGRVGNSEHDYYLVPQVSNPEPKEPGSYRDDTGAIKREAVKFRIYGFDSDGEVVAELTTDNSEIEWSAHVANLKSAWYEFSAALDLPQASELQMSHRNPDVDDPDERAKLVIDPGKRSITGRNQRGGADKIFDTGTFMGERVYLGEILTDEKGRLVVLGGRGHSNSPSGTPALDPEQPNGFGNAIGWYDDASDGPVDAQVMIAGKAIPVTGAWVAFGPPKFAPDIIGWRTLYDLLEQLFASNGMISVPNDVSFSQHVYPILLRMTALQWVNSGFAAMFGAEGPLNFADSELIDKLCRIHGERDAYAGLRREIYNAFRPAENNPGANPRAWPWIYGDAFGSFDDDLTSEIYLLLPERLEEILRAWMLGDFIEDWEELPVPPRRIEDVDLADQPMSLTKASLHFCAADAFHPGIELTWPMRQISMYDSPFRIRRNDGSLPKLDYGTFLTQEIALASDGPLNAQGPGGLTRWMLVPWQVDTAGCRSGYNRSFDPTLPAFWPAHVPNQILTESDYSVLMNTSKSSEERRNAFNHRESWYASMPVQGLQQFTRMVTYFGMMGIIEARPGPGDLAGIPETIFVQTLAKKAEEGAASLMQADVPELDAATRALRQAGFTSEKERQDIRKARFNHRD